MTDSARYETAAGVGWITVDDGKVNALSPSLQAEIGTALDAAERDRVVLVLQGRDGVFSGGFDLDVMRSSPAEAAGMVLGGFELARRLAAYPRPVVIACTGHAVAMGAFLLLAGDARLGIESDTKIVANEVAIGMTLPHAAITLLRHRLTPSAFQRAALLAQPFAPPNAVGAGFLDEVVPADRFDQRLREFATALTGLDETAQTQTKMRLRAPLLDDLTRAIERDREELGA